MIKMEKFLISKGPYAVDLGSLALKESRRDDGTSFWRATVNAVWFRRRRGVTVACIGYLWNYQNEKPVDALAFLKAHDDGRYGGTTLGRWDGAGFWGDGVSLEEQEEYLAILRPMLENYPAVPAGFDGWWRF